MRGAYADEAGRELVEIGLADDDGAGGAQPLHRGRIMHRRIREGRAGRGGRKSQRVDIVLYHDRHAIERQAGGVLRGELLGLRDRVLFVAQADEHGRIVVVADALIGACDRLRRRERARAMRGHNRGDRFRLLSPHSSPHGDKTPATALHPDRSKRCAIVYTIRAGRVLRILSGDQWLGGYFEGRVAVVPAPCRGAFA
ncbi:hypothetical protein ACVWYI_001069 [Bradyrhizobium sp. LB13.1]